MKRQHFSKYVLGLLGLGIALLPGLVASCELGLSEVTARGEIVYPVVTNSGRVAGKVRQQQDGWWEGLVHDQGALNERHPTIERARDAVCRSMAAD